MQRERESVKMKLCSGAQSRPRGCIPMAQYLCEVDNAESTPGQNAEGTIAGGSPLLYPPYRTSRRSVSGPVED